MPKKTVSLFFLIVFTLFVSAPTILSLIEKNHDTSVFFNVNEEENQTKETLKIFEVKLLKSDSFQLSSLDSESEKTNSFYLKQYTSHDMECISPPPELS